MDAQTQLVAELYKTLNDAQKQEVCNMIDTLLSQQLKDQQSLDSHSAATENQDSFKNKLLLATGKRNSQPTSNSWFADANTRRDLPQWDSRAFCSLPQR